MSRFASAVWMLEIQIVPVTLAVLLIEIPGYIQRRARLAYVPIYFAVFPLGELNKDLSIYLGEDYWYGGNSISENTAEQLRKKILFKSILSMAIASILIPLLGGFGTAFFLTNVTLRQFLIIAVLIKGSRIAKAIRDFPQHANGTMQNRVLLGFIYLMYLGVFIQMIRTAYGWTRPFVTSGNWSGLGASLGDVVFTKVTAGGIVVSLLSAAFVSLIADRDIRHRNLDERGDGRG